MEKYTRTAQFNYFDQKLQIESVQSEQNHSSPMV